MCEILQNAKLHKAGEISTLSPLYRATWTPSAPGQPHRKGTKSLLPFFSRMKHFSTVLVKVVNVNGSGFFHKKVSINRPFPCGLREEFFYQLDKLLQPV